MQLSTNLKNFFNINSKSFTCAPIWTKNFILLCLSNLALYISIQILLPTLPVYIIKIGYTQSDVGLVMGLFVFGTTLMRIISGWLVDRYERKKIMATGLFITLIITVLYSFANTLNLLAVTRLLHGLSLGLAGTAISTSVVDSLPYERVGEGIGYFGLASTISMATAPMIGLWIINTFSYSVLFIMVIILALLSYLFCLPVSGKNNLVTPPKIALKEIPKNMFEKTAILPSVMGFLMALVYSSVLYFIVLYGSLIKISNAGLFFAVVAIAMFISRPISGKMTDKGLLNHVFIISFVTIFVSIIFICLTKSITVFLLAAAFNGFGFGFCLPTLQTLAVGNAPAKRRGCATSTYFIGYELGLGIGAIILGWIAKIAGYNIMFLSTIIPLIFAAITYYFYKKKNT